MAVAGVLEIQMMASVARLSTDLNQAKTMVGSAMGNISRSVEQAKSALASLGITLGVGAFVHLIKGSIDAAEHLENLSKSTNLAVDTLAGLSVAAKQSGGDLDSIATSIDKLTVNIGKAPEKFLALGISAKDPLKAFQQLSDIFVNTTDPMQRNAVMAAALGKAWAGAAPLLAEGSAKIGEMVAKGTELSGITPEMTRQAKEFNDKLVLLVGTGGLLTRMVAPLLPILNAVANDMLEAQKQAKGLGDSGFSPLAESARAVVVLFGNVSFVLQGVGRDLGAMAAQIAALARGDFAAFALIGKEVTADAEAARVKFDAWEKSMMAVGTTATKSGAAVVAADTGAAASQAKRNAAFLGGTQAAADMEKQYLKLIRSIDEHTAATDRELSGQAKETAGQKIALDAMLKLQDGTLKLTAVQKIQLAAHLEGMLASEAALIRQNALIEAYVAILTASLEAEQESFVVKTAAQVLRDDAVKANQATVEQIQFETTLIGKSNEQRTIAIALRALELAGIKKEDQGYAALETSIRNAVAAQAKELTLAADLAHAAQTVADEWRKAGAIIAESAGKAFGPWGVAFGGMVKAFADGRATQTEIDDKFIKDLSTHNQDAAAIAAKYQDDTTQNSLKSYGDMAGAAASYFDKQSTAYKVLHGIEEAMYAMKFAMQLKAMLFDETATGVSVANSAIRATADGIAAFAKTLASLPFPYNLAAGAVVIAALAAVGVAISGGGSSGSGMSAADAQKQQGTGTVLGDSAAKSDSLLNSLKEIEKTDKLGLVISHAMLDALRAIQSNIAGLAGQIYRTPGLTGGAGVGSDTGRVLNVNPAQWMPGTDKVPFAAAIRGFVFGTVREEIIDAGLQIMGTVGNIIAHSSGSIMSYVNTRTTTTGILGGLFGGNGSSVGTNLSPIPTGLERSFSLTFAAIIDSIESAAKALDYIGQSPDGFSARLRAFVVDIGQISLDGLKGQELQDALNAVFSKFADQVSLAFFGTGEMQDLAKAGEGFYETLIRVATGNEYVKATFDMLGLSLGLVGMPAITARMNLIDLAGGLETFGKLTQDYYSKYYSPAKQHAMTGQALGTEFAAAGVNMPTDIAGFQAMIDGLSSSGALATAAGQALFLTLMKLAPTFYDFATQVVGLDGKMHSLDDVTKQHADLEDRLALAQGTKTQQQIERAHEMAGAIDQTTLTMLAAIYAQEDYNAGMAAATTRRRSEMSAEAELMEAQGNHAGALAQQRALDIQGMNAAEIASYDYIQSLKAQVAAQNKTNDMMATGNRLSIDLMRAHGNAADALAAERYLDIQGMNDQQIALYDLNQVMRDQIVLANAAHAAHDALVALNETLINSFKDAYRTIEMAGFTNEEQYKYLQKEAAGYTDSLKAATTGAQVQTFADKIKADMLSAFNLLSPDEQTRHKQEFLDNLLKISGMVSAQLASLDPTGSLAPEAIQAAAAATQQTAANRMLEAADEFNKIMGFAQGGRSSAGAAVESPYTGPAINPSWIESPAATTSMQNSAAMQQRAAELNRDAAALNREAAELMAEAAKIQGQAAVTPKRLVVDFPNQGRRVEAGI